MSPGGNDDETAGEESGVSPSKLAIMRIKTHKPTMVHIEHGHPVDPSSPSKAADDIETVGQHSELNQRPPRKRIPRPNLNNKKPEEEKNKKKKGEMDEEDHEDDSQQEMDDEGDLTQEEVKLAPQPLPKSPRVNLHDVNILEYFEHRRPQVPFNALVVGHQATVYQVSPPRHGGGVHGKQVQPESSGSTMDRNLQDYNHELDYYNGGGNGEGGFYEE